jgi:hypothetical protein
MIFTEGPCFPAGKRTVVSIRTGPQAADSERQSDRLTAGGRGGRCFKFESLQSAPSRFEPRPLASTQPTHTVRPGPGGTVLSFKFRGPGHCDLFRESASKYH